MNKKYYKATKKIVCAHIEIRLSKRRKWFAQNKLPCKGIVSKFEFLMNSRFFNDLFPPSVYVFTKWRPILSFKFITSFSNHQDNLYVFLSFSSFLRLRQIYFLTAWMIKPLDRINFPSYIKSFSHGIFNTDFFELKYLLKQIFSMPYNQQVGYTFERK